jgi:hypothetical protein
LCIVVTPITELMGVIVMIRGRNLQAKRFTAGDYFEVASASLRTCPRTAVEAILGVFSIGMVKRGAAVAAGQNRGYARFRSSFQSLHFGVCRSKAKGDNS